MSCAESPCQPKFCFSDLPVELQEHVIFEFQRDPDTTFDQLKALRLVCKTLDGVVTPRILSCIRLFTRRDNVLANLRQLQSLLLPKLNSNLHHTNVLVINDWRWIYGENHFMSFREMRNSGLWVPGIILNTTLLPFIYFLGFLFTPQFLPAGIFNTAVRLRARHRLSHTPRLNMPNVRTVIWMANRDDPNWTTSITVKLLLGFSQLTELILMIDEEQDLSFVANCLSKLHTLRKFKIDIRYWAGKIIRHRSFEIPEFGKIIGGNPHLTHLDLMQGYGAGGDLAKMFSYVPAEPPLMLEHLGISDTFLEPTAIVPHIRSLISFDLCSCWSSRFILILLIEGIFPPVIRTSRVDDHLIDFLSCHPRITSLSVNNTYDETAGRAILEIMARHAGSLKYFSTSPLSFCRCLEQDQNEILLLQCTNLEQLVLRYDYYMGINVGVPPNLETALSIISRLPESLTLVITDIIAFKACVTHCRQSWNPLVRSLTERIVHEKA